MIKIADPACDFSIHIQSRNAMTTKTFYFPFRRHALAIALAMVTGASHAAIINVSGTCTLINALNNANGNTDTDGAGTGCPAGNGADTLNLAAKATYTLTAINNSNQGPNGLPLVTSVITINGNGATIKRSSAADTDNFRLLRIVNGNLTVNNLRLTGGNITGDTLYGGGISNNGTLTLNNSIVSGNSASSAGTGILNGYAGILTLNSSTVSNNSGGGGAITDFGGTTTLNNSTVSGNRATGDNGGTGGIINLGNMKLVNSTVSGNSSLSPVSYGTGGIQNGGTMTLLHSTVSSNSIAHGNVTGIQNSRTLTLTNSLIANSKGGADCYSYMGSPTTPAAVITFQGANIIEDGTCGAPPSADPKLAPLLDNGGLTFTHALRAGSPAVNRVQSRCSLADQRGVKRPQPAGGLCDAGSFERITTTPANINNLISFFDQQAGSGGLIGTGPDFIAGHKRNALRNQILATGEYRARKLNLQACNQLARTLSRIDTDNTPDINDYVTGNEGDTLAAQISTLRNNWTCAN